MLVTKLKHSAWALVATAALSAAAFGVLPTSTAEAQNIPSVGAARLDDESLPAPGSTAEPASGPATHPTVTVNPGDSLWSMVQERLGPEAPPQQIAPEVEWLYELNRDRIGGDPNLIFPGQEFLVPPALMAEPAASAPQPQTTWGSLPQEEPATTARVASAASPALAQEAEPVASEPAPSEVFARSGGPATPEDPDTPQPAASEELATPEQVAEPVATEPAALPNNAPTDEEPPSPLAARRLLGVGILALTLFIALLMAWKLPMDRGVGRATEWRIPGGYHRERPPTATEPIQETEPAPSPLGATEPASRRGPTDPTGTEEAKPPSDGNEGPYPSPTARRRWEQLRRLRQGTTTRQRRRRPAR